MIGEEEMQTNKPAASRSNSLKEDWKSGIPGNQIITATGKQENEENKAAAKTG